MKRALLLSALLLAVIAGPAVAQNSWDLGLSMTPLLNGEDNEDVFENVITGFHIGYQFLYLFYGSWDALVMPPSMIESMTATFVRQADGSTVYQEGYLLPGYLNLVDAGIRIILGPFSVQAELGINQIYVYQQSTLDDPPESGFGANVLLGAGLKFGWWGVGLRGLVVFPSIDSAITTVASIFSDDEEFADQALQTFVDNLIPSLMFTIYLGGN